MILAGERVRIVETHLRPAGDQIPYLLAHARGIDLIDALARQSVGLPALAGVARVLAAPAAREYAAIWYSYPGSVGEVGSVGGLDEARAVPGVREVEVLIGPGGRLAGTAGSASRAAYAWATGPTAAVATQRARTAVGLLTFSMAGQVVFV